MGQEVILNGRMSSVAPDEAVVINRAARFQPPIINGLMPTDVTINGLARPPILNGCVLYLPFYHSKLSRPAPASFKSLDAWKHGVIVTGALWTPQGRRFNGTTDKIIVPGFHSVLTDLLTLTYLVWVKFDAPYGEINPFLIGKEIAFAPANWLYVNAANQDVVLDRGFADTNLSANSENGVVVAGTWVNIGATIDSNKLPRIYIDGLEISSYVNQRAGVGALTTDASARFIVGNSQGLLRALDGQIGEVLVYNRALSEAEIQQAFQATKWRYL